MVPGNFSAYALYEGGGTPHKDSTAPKGPLDCARWTIARNLTEAMLPSDSALLRSAVERWAHLAVSKLAAKRPSEKERSVAAKEPT